MAFVSRLGATAALWWRMMRMQRITREGWFYVLFTLVVGAAAINTGNNLLYLVLGLLVSFLLLSAFLSEMVLGGLRIERRLPPHGVAGQRLRVGWVVHNRKRRFASHSLALNEIGVADCTAYLQRVGPRGERTTWWSHTLPRRGHLELRGVRISTRFPFGLFEKTREFELPDSLPVHPAGSLEGEAQARMPAALGAASEPHPGWGTEFHALREYREGDDLRRVHWRSTARVGRLLVVETDRQRRGRITLLVDTRGAEGPEALDGAADLLVALARRLLAEGCEVGVRTQGEEVAPGAGDRHLRSVAALAARLAPAREESGAPNPFAGTEGIEIPHVAAPTPREAPPASVDQVAAAAGRLDLGLTQRWSVRGAALVAFASMVISGQVQPWVLLVFGACFLGGVWVREAPSKRLREVVATGTVLALLVLAAGTVLGGWDVMIAAPTFAALLAASRLLTRRGPQDDPLLLLSSLMMLAGGAALTGEIAYGLLFACFAVLGTVALATTHLRRESEGRGVRVPPQAAGAPMPRQAVSGALLGFLAGISGTVLVGSLFVFLAFPRVSVGVLSRVDVGRVGGGGDRIELGGVGVLKDDPTPVMRVQFPGGAPPGELYWRTSVFGGWDGRGWSLAQGERQAVAGGGGLFLVGKRQEGRRTAIDVELLREVRSLPVPAHLLAVRFPFRRGMPAPQLVAVGEGFEVEDAPSPLRYQLQIGDEAAAQVQVQDPGSSIATWLEVPPRLDPRVRALARSFPEQDPLALALAMERRLQADHRYSRELPGQVDDPLAHFLFERREGHCEYFATALALLLRLRGVPARVVAGYYGVSWVEAGGYWVVREGDAHAWTEAWIPGRGWMRLDATPAEDRPGVAEGAWASVVEWVDVWRMRWASWVLDYDARSQAQLARGLSRGWSGGRGSAGGSSLGAAFRWVVVALLFTGAIVWALRAGSRWRRGERIGVGSASARRAIWLYRRIKRHLRKRGVQLGASATSREWEAAAREVLGAERVVPLQEALATYERARFGGAPLQGERARSLERRVAAAVRRK